MLACMLDRPEDVNTEKIVSVITPFAVSARAKRLSATRSAGPHRLASQRALCMGSAWYVNTPLLVHCAVPKTLRHLTLMCDHSVTPAGFVVHLAPVTALQEIPT